jgi:hypothetical protein
LAIACGSGIGYTSPFALGLVSVQKNPGSIDVKCETLSASLLEGKSGEKENRT